MRVRWSDIAVADLEDIYDYIARDVPYYADLLADRLDEAINKLDRYPRIGRAVPEAGYRSDIRELLVQRFRVIYRVTADEIQVLTIVHGSRDLATRARSLWEDE